MEEETVQKYKGKILLVDDKEYIRDFCQQVLSNAGYSVDTAADGTEALEKVRNNKYPLILSDMNYPAIDEFISAVAGIYSIAAITGNREHYESVVKRNRLMEIPLLEKPFGVEKLVEFIRENYPKNP